MNASRTGLALLLTSLAAAALAQAPDRSLVEAQATLKRYCFDCHGAGLAEARVNLEEMASRPESIGRDFKDWQRAVRMLRLAKMPPPDAQQPSDQERQDTIAAVESALAAFIEQHAGDPGEVVLRRLTSAEFGYCVQDLTGLDLKLERRFVSDGVGGEGFTNVGAAQFIDDAVLQQYLDAAREVADHAVIGAGPLAFFEHPGESGRELSAISRINEIYRRHGFRTAAGEGAEPFGLDLYPRAFYVAWQYRHRQALGLADMDLVKLANREAVSARLCQHVWRVLDDPPDSFPTAQIAAGWRSLPRPAEEKPAEAEVRAACQRLVDEMREWQRVLAASAGDEEEAAVLTAGNIDVAAKHELTADLNWPDDARTAEIELSVATASQQPAAGAIVVWRDASVRFRTRDRRRREPVPLASLLDRETAERLALGKHPAGVSLGENDFVLRGETKIPLKLLIPEGMRSARLSVELQLDTEHGADAIVRCRISDGPVEGETAAEVGDSSTLLGNPDGATARTWQAGVAEFARLLPEVSHREAAPSDRDPIPEPFDNTYNMPERNHFHATIKYHRDDSFLVEHVLDDETRAELDRAWTDLLTSFDYHDLHLRFLEKKFGFDTGGKGVGELAPDEIERLPDEPRGYVRRLQSEWQSMQQRLVAAEAWHIEDALDFAARAWRRRLRDEDARLLRAFYGQLRGEGNLSHAAAMRALLVRILVAPAFLYRAEPAARPETSVAGRVVPLTDWELASRLSFFLWSSLPDEELAQAAASGQLREPEQLEKQVRRMLRDPKARRLATEFFGQWLGFYRFDEYRGIDTSRFPEFNDRLREAMYREAVTFFEHVVREDRPPAEILFADYTFLNRELAEHYGIDGDQLPASDYVRVDGLAEQHRGGLLGMGAVLAATSAPLRTSAVKRGDWVLRRILGTPVPPPPADAGSIPADEALGDGLTVRQRLEAHRSDASCVNCHARIDPLGFALEHYDLLGRWREAYRDGQAIDSSGTLSDGTHIQGVSGLQQHLRAEQSQFERQLCGKLLGYALGRSELASDQPLIDQMLADLKEGGGMSNLVARIVTSRQFRYRRW